jgi:hypothetical protein
MDRAIPPSSGVDTPPTASHAVAMSDPTGPRDVGDAGGSDARLGGGVPGTRGEDEVDSETAPTGAWDVPADERGSSGVAGPARHDREHEWAMGDTEWTASPGYQEAGGERKIPAFLVGALTGMVALGLLWAGTALLNGTGTDGRRAASSSATAEVKPSQHTPVAPEPSRANPCRRVDQALAGALRTATPALDQWEVHVGAMNKLVVGSITSQQAAAFWSQTKVGATRNLGRFYSATQRLPFAGVNCPSSTDSTQASAEARSCARQVAQERRALHAVRIALRTWKKHIRHMRMLDMGHLSPAAATQMWLANWQRGIREIRDYRSAQRAVDRPDSC